MKRIFECLILVAFLFSANPLFANSLQSGVYAAVKSENQSKLIEMFQVKIFNQKDGNIQVSTNEGKSWQSIGKVLYPTEKTNDNGYTASRWANDGCIAATAVNAIHIRTGYNDTRDLGVMLSLIPRELLNVSAGYSSYRSPDSSIYTDIPAGTSLFGGLYAPFVGNRVLVNSLPMPARYVPKVGDILIMIVERPVKYPTQLVFENRFGGLIKLVYGNNEVKYIGQVLKPVVGVGRFLGTQYVDVGRIRANHTGVIDISTSPLGEIGGFQIIPANHAMDKEMLSARTLTQWMVISSLNGLNPSPDGVAPLFANYIRPEWVPLDLDDPNWVQGLLGRFLVEVRIEGSNDWQPMPEFSVTEYMGKNLPGWPMTALKNVTHVRILFPVY